MTKRENDLDRLTTLLGQCLGRIDEQAYRLQQQDGGEDEPNVATSHVLENEAAMLQELVGSLLEKEPSPDHADLNRVVDQAVQSCIAEIGMPIVTRQRLATNLPEVACGPGQLAFAVQRALVIALGRQEPGGEVIVTTRRLDDTVLLELESQGAGRDHHLQERTLTLCEFVAGLRGHCRVDADQRGTLLIVLELPQALAIDEY